MLASFIFNPSKVSYLHGTKIILPALCALLLLPAVTIQTKSDVPARFSYAGKNDRIEVEGLTILMWQGVACYISYAKKVV